MSTRSSESAVARVVSGSNTLSSSELSRYSVDGLTPEVVVVPETLEEVSEIMKRASEEGVSVTPWGGGTMMTLGGIPRRVDLVLLLQKLNQVIEYAPEDLVVTVEAGIRLADLQKVLRGKKQFLPLDPPYASSATLGGIVSANSFGPRRHLYGGIRDLLLGIMMVHADGAVTKAGGKVMKNVAGYDLRKLYVGSLGTLGVIAQITFKVYPLPMFEATSISSFTSFNSFVQAAHEVLMTIHSSIGIGSFAVEGFDPASSRILREAGFDVPEGYMLAVGVMSMSRRSMEMRLSELEVVAKKYEAAATYSFEGEQHNTFWNTVQDFPALALDKAGFSVRCKVATVISKVGEVMNATRAAAEKHGLRSSIISHMGLGILYFYMDSGKPDEVAKTVKEGRKYVLNTGGSLVVEAAPVEVKQKVDVWGPVRKDFPIMQAIKSRFDPREVLNPGRYVGRI